MLKMTLLGLNLAEQLGVFNPYIVIDDPGYDNHINGIIDLTDKWIGVRQLFL